MDNTNETTTETTLEATENAPVSPTEQERSVGALAHLLTLTGFIIPLGGLIAPLIVYLVKKDESSFVAAQALEAINFQITLFIATLICIALVFTLIGIPFAVLGLLTLVIADVVLVIIAAVKVSDGKEFRYPYCIRIL
ncbi:DUF4870 domain-containing protein [uncultured Umboniibacter sp.]|uniref:DUF4870 domain-containing protein n=1 Tax=uncultured Umboniibacter sp. TaxID=1798917 RepID=UPI0026145361|nr:DUF4870 domain-containing protein [uncultured Umboniibacter sp.]